MVPWGAEQVVNRGSTVVLKALAKKSLLVNDAEVSAFSHWLVDGEEKGKEPLLRLTVEQDTAVTAVFVAK